MFSSYWCTAIFAKSRSLHYVLKKTEEIDIKNDDTEEGTMLSEKKQNSAPFTSEKQRTML
jgi:hypothetical protein